MKRTNLFRRLLTALVVVAMAVPLTAGAAINQILYNAVYNGTPVLGTDTLGGVTYSTVSFGDLYNGGNPGAPSLPVDFIRFSVPYNATNFSVMSMCLPTNLTNYNLSHLVYPCQAPRMMNDTTPVVITLPDSSAYFSGSYLSQMAWVVDEGFLAGENHIVTVAVMPLAYTHTPTTNKVTLRKRITLNLRYDLSDSLAMYPIVRNDSAMREEGYSLTRSQVVNPNQVKPFAPMSISTQFDSLIVNPNGGMGYELNGYGHGDDTIPGLPLGPPQLDSIGKGIGVMYMNDVKYLIVTTSDLYHSMRRLAALKRQKGYTVAVVTIDQILQDSVKLGGDWVKKSDGYHLTYTDPAGLLRQFIRNCYYTCGTKFVLLAGTSIPYRHREQVVQNVQVNDTIDGISDFYYSELHSDWSDSNIMMDHGPELYVGRILSHSSNQIDNYTDKVYRYELNPGRGDYSYLTRAFFSEGRDYKRQLKQFKDSLENIYTDLIIMNDFSNNHSSYPNGADVIDTIRSKPVGLMCIFNHGDTTKIRVYGEDLYKNNYFIYSTSSDNQGDGLNHLDNKFYPFIYYSPSCTTVPFDNKTGLNMGESFTTGKDYGGPVYMGYTRKVLFETNKYVTDCFAKRIKNGYITLGETEALSVWDYRLQQFQKQDPSPIHAYIGDPSIKLWTATPNVYDNITTTRNDNSITVNGINGETIIAYYGNDGKMGKMTASSTIKLNQVSPNSSIMLYNHNQIPYFVPLELQKVTLNKSQYVIANDVVAGNHIDSNRTHGDVTVKSGVEYEIEASGTVRLEDGFIVEKGATFAVYPASF